MGSDDLIVIEKQRLSISGAYVWMVKHSGATALTPTTPVSLSKLVFAHTPYTWNEHGFLSGIYRYDLMPVDQYGNALASATAPIQFTIAGSG